MKKLIVSNMYPSERHPAYGSFVKEQVEELKKKNVDIELVVSDIKDGGKGTKLKKYLTIWFKTLIKSFSRKIDTVHIHYVFPTGIIVFLLKYLLGKKIFLTVHGSDMIGAGNLKTKLLNAIFKTSDKVIVVSEYLKEIALTKHGVPKEKLEVINCGVNREMFAPVDKEKAKEEKNLPQDKKMVLYLGTLNKNKGIYTFLDVIKNNTFENVSFVIVGEGPEKENAINELKNTNRDVKFYDAVPKTEVSKWFNAADLFIFPTKKEAFGLVALESLSCKTPVIASNIGGVPETIKDGINGCLVEEGDYQGIIDKIDALLSDEEKYQKLVENCEEQANENTIEKQINKLIELYQ